MNTMGKITNTYEINQYSKEFVLKQSKKSILKRYLMKLYCFTYLKHKGKF